ncbi:MAG: porphobilinogen synthase [Anaerolineae bacterium]
MDSVLDVPRLNTSIPRLLRPRRLRRSPTIRSLVRETVLTPADFVLPLFIVHGRNVRHPVGSMPGVFQLSVDNAVLEAEAAARLGIPAILLFGLPAEKDAIGSENFDPHGIIPTAIRAIKSSVPEVAIITDVCMCEYTDHGHCGVIHNGTVHNDETLSVLARVAVAHADAGADIVAPSAMMDGQVAAIREGLDTNGFSDVAILAYAAKFASSFYGPFREAADSPPQFGDRKSYQMDPANGREALREVALDVAEGADMVMVKPALAYLDIVRQVRDRFELPVAAYNVSGEYAMIKAAAANGWIDERNVALEMLAGIKRAGADFILTYFALDAARWLRE